MERATSLKIKDKNPDSIDELLEFLSGKYIVIPTSDKKEDPDGWFVFVSITSRDGDKQKKTNKEPSKKDREYHDKSNAT